MAIVVEDGSGKSDADAFISVSDLETYLDARGHDHSSYHSGEKEQAIVRATDYLTDAFRWAGYRRRGRDQSLEWPRIGLVDKDGYSIDEDEIPVEVEAAAAETAWYELQNPNGLQPVYTPHDRVTMLKAGPVALTFDKSSTDPEGARPIILIVRDLIAEFLEGGERGSSLSGEAQRA